jgi:hypothetical protein
MLDLSSVGGFPDFQHLMEAIPELSARIMGYIGKQAALDLFQNHLQGQDITFRHYSLGSSGLPRDKKGRGMVSWSVGRGAKSVRVSSYPLNLFEGGRRLRGSAGEEAPRKIIRGKLKSDISGRMDSLLKEAKNHVIEAFITEFERSGNEKHIADT